MAAKFPPARPHGEIQELFPDVFFVSGTMQFPGPVPIAISRNMTVVRDGGALTILNSVRLGDEGLRALDALGKVKHVVRVAGFHGSDDAFYKDRCGATVWAVKGQVYSRGFNPRPKPDAIYFRADREMVPGGELPTAGLLHTFPSVTPGEGIVVLDREGGIAVPGDSLQNWSGPDPYFNWMGRMVMRPMGFFRPHNVGPGWLRQLKPDPAELAAVLDLPFDHVLPAHGAPVVRGAREQYRPSIEWATAWLAKARSEGGGRQR